MAAIDTLLTAMDERQLARNVGLHHDEARMRYQLRSNTVADFPEFKRIIADYYNYHFTTCISRGGSLPQAEAYGRAKEILEREYRRRDGDITSAFNDAHDGTNGGLRVVLDKLADGLKVASVELYITELFDRHVTPSDWDQKVEIVRQFMERCGPYLGSSISVGQPERYAQNYSELIREYVRGLQSSSAMFRRF